MSHVLCLFGWHKWKNVVRMHAPVRAVAEIPMVGHLWQHPSTWPVMRVPYTKTYDIVCRQCARCGERKP